MVDAELEKNLEFLEHEEFPEVVVVALFIAIVVVYLLTE